MEKPRRRRQPSRGVADLRKQADMNQPTNRQCITCDAAFYGRYRECWRCRRIPKPCEFIGCENPKVPGHGSQLCQEHRDNADERKLERLRAKTLAKACQWPDCPELKQGGRGSRYCAEHSTQGAERERARMRHRSRERMYGIAPEEYQALLEAQEGLCAVCGNGPTGRRLLSVDHDHVTGEVRGLLCNRCNPMLGYARDDVAVLQAAIEYLSRPRRPASA
jgi:Recombination endonuclease VII